MNVRLGAAAIVVLAIGGSGGASQNAGKASDVLAATRKAIGDTKIAGLKTFSVEGTMQRNVGSMQLSSEVELLLELPDKYARSEMLNGPGVLSSGGTTGFNGDKPLRKVGSVGGGGAMVIRMGGPGGGTAGSGEKLSPEEQEKADRGFIRSARFDLSRLMLGWFGMVHPQVNADYSFAGEAESPDGKAFVIDARNADGFEARLFIDEQTHLPLMVTYKGPQPRTITRNSGDGSPGDLQKRLQEMQKEPPVMVDYSLFFEDWQDTDGLMFPRKIRRAIASTTVEEWTITRVRVNPKIDAKKFAVEG
jgi:hypothetical protein